MENLKVRKMWNLSNNLNKPSMKKRNEVAEELEGWEEDIKFLADEKLLARDWLSKEDEEVQTNNRL